jgi:hypothetical protein
LPRLIQGAAAQFTYNVPPTPPFLLVAEALLVRGERVVIADEMNDYYDLRLKRANIARLQSAFGPSKVTVREGDLSDGAFVDGLFGEHTRCYSGSIAWSTYFPIESPCFPMWFRCVVRYYIVQQTHDLRRPATSRIVKSRESS